MDTLITIGVGLLACTLTALVFLGMGSTLLSRDDPKGEKILAGFMMSLAIILIGIVLHGIGSCVKIGIKKLTSHDKPAITLEK